MVICHFRECSDTQHTGRSPAPGHIQPQGPTGQVGELAARLHEAEAEREVLQTTAKTIRAMAADPDLE